jgi:hypothetical protein
LLASQPAPQQDPASPPPLSTHEKQQQPEQSNNISQQGSISHPQQQQQQQPLQHTVLSRLQPQDLTTVLAQLSDNAEAISAAEEVLEGLLLRQATLHQLGRKMEQHQVP